MKKILLYIFLAFLLLVLFAAVYVFTPDHSAPAVPERRAVSAGPSAAVPAGPVYEPPSALPPVVRQTPQAVRRPAPVSRRVPAQTRPAESAPASVPVYASAPSSGKTVKTPSRTTAPRPAVKSQPAGRGSIYTQAAASYSGGGNVPVFGEREDAARERERQAILSGASSGLGSRDQRALNERLAQMSAGIDRAVAQALFPKSRRAQNLEKYLNRQSGAAAAGGASQSAAQQAGSSAPVSAEESARQVAQQINTQKASIVDSMRESYGSSAAREAGKIMDSFAKEMNAVMSAPGDPQEKQIRAAAVNNKYNEKLRKLNEKEGMKKRETEMQTQNDKQVQKIAETLGPEVAAAVRQKYDEYTPKRLAVLEGGYSSADVTRLLMELDEQMNKDVQQILAQHHPLDPQAMNKYIEAQNQVIQEEQRQWERLPENQRPREAVWANDAESVKMQETKMNKQSEEIQKGFAMYGPEVQARAKQILDDANRQYLELIEQGGATARDTNEVLNKANEQLKALQAQAQEDLRAQAEALANQQ